MLNPLDGYIYTAPGSAQHVLKIDPSARTVEPWGESFLDDEGKHDDRIKWVGTVLAGNGCAYGVPFQAKRVLKMDLVSS